MRRFVVITGLPASGKSTVGRVIAAGLDLPLLDKDDFLEALFRRAEPKDTVKRSALSRIADESFRVSALEHTTAVLTSWWRHPRSPSESGTPVQWLSSGAVVEVHCSCPPLVAVARFLARARHPGHLDRLRSRDQLLREFTEQASLGPLGVGSLVEVDTTGALENAAILAQINQAFAKRRA